MTTNLTPRLDIFGNTLCYGDTVALHADKGMLVGTIVDFTDKNVRVEFDTKKYPWAVTYGYKWGIHRGKKPTLLAPPGQVVKQIVNKEAHNV